MRLIFHLQSNQQAPHPLKQSGFKKKKDTAIRILKRKQIHTKPHNKEEKPFQINFSKAPRCYSIRKPPPGVINEVSALKMDPKQI